MATSESIDSDTVFQILQDLDPFEFSQLVAEICAIRGWKPQITIADSDYVGDIFASKTLPFPKSVSLIHYDDGELTRRRLEDLLHRTSSEPASRLAIIVHKPPAEDVLSLANESGVGIIGLSDLAESIVMLSTVDILETYVEKDDQLWEKYSNLFEESDVEEHKHSTQQSSIPNSVEATSAESDGVGFATTLEDFQNADQQSVERVVNQIYDSLEADLRGRVVENPEDAIPDVEFGDSYVVAECKQAGRKVVSLLELSEAVSDYTVDMITDLNDHGTMRVEELCEIYEEGKLEAVENRTTEETLDEKILETVDNQRESTLKILSDA